MAYASLAEYKADYGIAATTTDDDALIRNALEQASAFIDNRCGRWFEGRTQTRYYEAEAVDGDTLHLDADLISITTLTNGDSSGTTIASTEYWTLPRQGGPPYYAIRLKSASTYSWEWDTDGWVSVAGEWGWTLSPPEPVVKACKIMANFYYNQRDVDTYNTTVFPEAGVITTPAGTPPIVLDLLAPFMRRA